MNTLRKLALLSLAAPLALGLAACSEQDAATGEVAQAEAIAPIEAPEGQAWTQMVQVTDMDGYLLGNPDAPIKVIEYGSLTCPACAAFSVAGAEELENDYVASGRVSYELRNQVHNGIDLVLARLVRCGQPESFHPLSNQVWANLDSLLGNAQANPQAVEAAMSLPEEERYIAVAEAAGLLDFFAARGISRDQARTCLADTASVQQIAENSDAQSRELNVTKTPTFIVNGSQVDASSWEALEPILQRAGAR